MRQSPDPRALAGLPAGAPNAEHFDLVASLQGHTSRPSSTPTRMRFPLSQTDYLLVGLIEEPRDGVAVPNHGAYERQDGRSGPEGRRFHHLFNGWRNPSFAVASKAGRAAVAFPGELMLAIAVSDLPHCYVIPNELTLRLRRWRAAGQHGPAVLWAATRSPTGPPYSWWR